LRALWFAYEDDGSNVVRPAEETQQLFGLARVFARQPIQHLGNFSDVGVRHGREDRGQYIVEEGRIFGIATGAGLAVGALEALKA